MLTCYCCELSFFHVFLLDSDEEPIGVTGLINASHTLLSFASLTWTPARNPVPRLEGQVKTYPRRSFHMNSQPRSLINLSTCRCKKQRKLLLFKIQMFVTFYQCEPEIYYANF